MADAPLRVCYFGTYRAQYQRNRFLIDGLRRNGVEVVECHEQLWHSIEDRVQATQGGWMRPAFIWRVLQTYVRLIVKAFRLGGNYDVMVVGYPGQFDVYLAKLFTLFHRKPMAWDILMSIYLVAVERRLQAKGRRTIAMIRRIEQLACKLPHRLIMNTQPYIEWFEENYQIPAHRFDLISMGTDSQIFAPDPLVEEPEGAGGEFRALYYGTYIPNHGVPIIIEAARLLAQHPQITFEMVGEGPDRAEAERLAQAYGLTNITFTGWLEPHVLRKRIAQSHVCLGVFSTTPQSLMTIHNKIYEGLAMAKPVLTGEGPGVCSAFAHGRELYLCRRLDARDLADSLLALYADRELCRRIAAQGHQTFLAHYTIEQIGARFKSLLVDLAAEHGNAHRGMSRRVEP